MNIVRINAVGRVVPIQNVIPAMGVQSSLLSACLPAILIVLASYGSRLPLLVTRGFDFDEFEHLHVAWLISTGLLPYRDFFEHHTPFFHFALAPFFSGFAVSTNVADAIAFLFFARRLMWLLAGLILFLTCWIGTLWRDARVGCVAMLLLSNTAVFLTVTLEIRPDVLASVFWLLCLTAALYAVESSSTSTISSAARFAASGVFLGLAVLTTQKMLFAVPGFAAGLGWYMIEPRVGADRYRRVQGVACAAMGVLLPIALMLTYFYVRNGLPAFVKYNIVFNAQWKEHFSPFNDLRMVAYQNPYLVMCGIAGLGRAVLQLIRGHHRASNSVLAAATLSVIGGVFVVPVAQNQYYLMVLPLLALFAGDFLIEAFDTLASLRERMHVREWLALVGAVGLTVIAILLLAGWNMDSPWAAWVVVGYWSGALVMVVALLYARRPVLAIPLFLVIVSVPHLKQVRDTFVDRNTAQLREVRYIMDHTDLGDTVMDGFTGTGVFRSHAYFYFMPHQGVRLMLTQAEWSELLEGLESGRIAPKLVIFDKYLRALPPPITEFLAERYAPVGIGDIRRRKE